MEGKGAGVNIIVVTGAADDPDADPEAVDVGPDVDCVGLKVPVGLEVDANGETTADTVALLLALELGGSTGTEIGVGGGKCRCCPRLGYQGVPGV